MAKTEARPEEVPREQGGGRVDSVKPPPNLPDTSPFDRMTELTRRIVGVPKDEALKPAERPRRKHR